MSDYKNARILSIDAWGNSEGGWDWNQWYHVGEFPTKLLDKSNRVLLRWLRENDFLGKASIGKCAIEDDGFNIVVLQRSNNMPLYAIEYGCLDEQ